MNSKQRRKAQRLHTKAIANDLILFRLLGGNETVPFFRVYTPRKHGLLRQHIKNLQEK